MKSCDCWDYFLKLLTGNRLQSLCNRLHSYFSWTVVTLNLKFEFPTFRVTSNRLQYVGNRLHILKTFEKCLKWFSESFCVSGNRLQSLVIDYQKKNFKIICFERRITWSNLCAFRSNLRIYLVNLTWISWIAWCLLELSMKTNLSWN